MGQLRGSATGWEEHCKVLVPLGQVSSFHHASVSPGKGQKAVGGDPGWPKVWLLGAHVIYTGDGGIIVLLPQHRTRDRLPGLARGWSWEV